jgi:hypothetical protein
VAVVAVVVVIATGRETVLVATGLGAVVGSVVLTVCEAGFKGAAVLAVVVLVAVLATTPTLEEAEGAATGHGTLAVVVPEVKIGEGTFPVVVEVVVAEVVLLDEGKRVAGKFNFCAVGTARTGLTAVEVATEAGLTAFVVPFLVLLAAATVAVLLLAAIGFGVVVDVDSVVVMM